MKQENHIKLYTIGFTKKNAEIFFGLLINNKVKRVIDIRLNNTSQLAGFAKADDLRYFLKAAAGIEYIYLPEFAPTDELMSDYKNKKTDRKDFAKSYTALIASRKVDKLDKNIFNDACLLCSEHKPDECHRSLAAEFLQKKWGNLEITHLF
ncbi:MAG: DUF488 family protein [Syntrophothermus sp.]